MTLDAVLLTIALAQEGIYRQPAPHVSTAVVVEVESFAGNDLYPTVDLPADYNNGCFEHPVERAELDNDGQPCVRTVDNYVTTGDYGDAVVSADDLAPATCDSGTGFNMVVSVWRARQLIELNPGLVCEFGVERYGAVG